jgi:hypothetical protein
MLLMGREMHIGSDVKCPLFSFVLSTFYKILLKMCAVLKFFHIWVGGGWRNFNGQAAGMKKHLEKYA